MLGIAILLTPYSGVHTPAPKHAVREAVTALQAEVQKVKTAETEAEADVQLEVQLNEEQVGESIPHPSLSRA